MRRGGGSPAAAALDEPSPAILNDPTEPLKSGGRPAVGSSNTVNSDGRLAAVMSLVTLAPKIFCPNGSPSMSSIIESRCGVVRILTVSGDSTDRENLPGLTAATTLCHVSTVYGLPSMALRVCSG